MQAAIVIVIVLLVIVIVLQLVFRPQRKDDSALFTAWIDRLQSGLKQDFLLNRTESALLAKENRMELNNTLRAFMAEQKQKFDELKHGQHELSEKTIEQLEKISRLIETRLVALAEQDKNNSRQMRDALDNAFKGFRETFDKNVESFNSLQKEKFGQLDLRQTQLLESNEKKLEEMRATVDEKLQKTLQERLGQSFDMVSRQLESVQKGLGEMQALAQDVGGLKKVLGNVKMRGGIGEVQLAMLLEQVLAPEQYAANVKTKADSQDLVEFAIRLPGRDEGKQRGMVTGRC